MASEPAEPTTRQHDVIEQAGELIDEHMFDGRNDYGYDRCDCGWVGEGPGQWPDHITYVLGEAGLLADPGQTTELEELRARLDAALEWWRQERDADHCWPLSFEDSAKVNSLRYRLYAALTGHPLAEQPLPAEREEQRARLVPTVHKLRAELDGAHLTLDTMAGRLNQARAERDALLPRLAELAEQAGKLRSAEWLRTCASLPIEEWPPAPAYKGPMVPAAERDERQARIDAALVECNRDYPIGRVPIDELPTAAQICDRIRAALVGDQPKAEAPWFVVRHCCEAGARAYPDPCSWHPALSGEALRDVEEADDAAGDLP